MNKSKKLFNSEDFDKKQPLFEPEDFDKSVKRIRRMKRDKYLYQKTIHLLLILSKSLVRQKSLVVLSLRH